MELKKNTWYVDYLNSVKIILIFQLNIKKILWNINELYEMYVRVVF